jgi:hypothetical protein
LLGEVLCESSDGGGFSCAEETADHDVFSGHWFWGEDCEKGRLGAGLVSVE